MCVSHLPLDDSSCLETLLLKWSFFIYSLCVLDTMMGVIQAWPLILSITLQVKIIIFIPHMKTSGRQNMWLPKTENQECGTADPQRKKYSGKGGDERGKRLLEPRLLNTMLARQWWKKVGGNTTKEASEASVVRLQVLWRISSTHSTIICAGSPTHQSHTPQSYLLFLFWFRPQFVSWERSLFLPLKSHKIHGP